MPVVYLYNNKVFNTEDEAQAEVDALVVRLENNPTDWMIAREITGSLETGWVLTNTKLTDEEILNPDNTKTYMCCSIQGGENAMPVTVTELNAKRIEYRTYYCRWLHVDQISKHDDTTDPSTVTIITPTTDMSGYV